MTKIEEYQKCRPCRSKMTRGENEENKPNVRKALVSHMKIRMKNAGRNEK